MGVGFSFGFSPADPVPCRRRHQDRPCVFEGRSWGWVIGNGCSGALVCMYCFLAVILVFVFPFFLCILFFAVLVRLFAMFSVSFPGCCSGVLPVSCLVVVFTRFFTASSTTSVIVMCLDPCAYNLASSSFLSPSVLRPPLLSSVVCLVEFCGFSLSALCLLAVC